MTISPAATRSFGVIFCVFLIFAIGVLSGMAVLDKAPSSNTDSWLFRWQTFIGAVVALIAAGIGAWFLNKQITTARRIEEEKRRLRRTAIRAILPLSLSELCDYAMRCSEKLTFLHEACEDEILDRHSEIDRTFPSLPKDVSTTFRDFIECADEEHARPLIDILSKIQVQSARFREIELNPPNAPMVMKLNIESYIVENAELYARAAAVFDYARFRAETCKFGDQKNSILSTLRIFRYADDLRYARMMAWVERSYI